MHGFKYRGRAAPEGVGIKISGGPWEAFPCFPGVKAQEVFYSNG